MTFKKAILILLMQRYLNGMLDTSISLLEIHKLLYFMQETGENLHLKYEKCNYGIYAINFNCIYNDIEEYYIYKYNKMCNNPYKKLNLLPDLTEEAEIFLNRYPKTQKNFKKVSSLIEGFETFIGLELLSTVHWFYKYEEKKETDELIKSIYCWNNKIKYFTKRQFIIAKEILINKNWLIK